MNIIIPMAGLGSRFSKNGIKTPKPLIKVNGKTLIEHSVESLGIPGRYIFITRNYEDPQYNEELTKILKKLDPNCEEIRIDNVTSGCSETCLYAKHLIDNEEELIITNCDQLMDWDPNAFLEEVSDNLSVDGAVVLFKSKDPKNSFAKIKENYTNGCKIVKIVEKDPISDNALVGIHYWARGKDFVESSENLLKHFRISGLPECYISETYNYLIERNYSIVPFFIPKNSYIPLGTPEDVSIYLGKLKEFYTNKPKTIFCDLDGTVLKHCHKFSDLNQIDPEVLPGVNNKFNEWDSKGYKIILTTARKESAREMTENHLKSLGICWDHLIMGVSSGVRVLINDKLKDEDNDRSVAINLITDSGFDSVDWEKYNL
jgi:NDP-sugar pyrophosphorylase family protein